MTNQVNIRELVLETLLMITKQEEYSHIALSAVLDKYQYLSKQERSFITRLTEGVIERQIELDYIIHQFSKVKVNKMKPVIRCIMRMGVYQIKYMDAVPDSAACNEAVKLAQRKGFSQLKGFVNGVLRNIARELDTVTYPDEAKDFSYAISVRYSIPEWMIVQWEEDYGREVAKKIAGSFLEKTGTVIRVNENKISAKELKERLESQGITVEEIVWEEYPDFSEGLCIRDYDYLGAIPEFNEGYFFVQDMSSMFVTYLASPKKDSYVIDVCSAPGGKSIHIAQKLSGSGMVEARDLTQYKVSMIEDNIQRMGISNIKAVQKDARVLDKESIDKADLVICDLPCSGLGVLRKKTDIRYRMTKDAERDLQKLQREILSVSCQYVKPGGVLMYSTCTIDRLENEENTRWFLEQHKEFRLEKERQIFPFEHHADGFYVAKLVREDR